MSKGTDEMAQDELEHHFDEETGRRGGLLAVIAILAIVGIALWLLMSNDEAT